MRKLTVRRYIILILVVSIMQTVFSINVQAEEGTNAIREIDIMTTPEKVFFDLGNLKPGDWSTKTLVIKNSGKEDFDYTFSSIRKAGSKDLYKELELTVLDKDGEIYQGELGEFQKLDARSLTSGESEELEFTIKFPEQLGNEFQGLFTEVEFKFYAEGTLGGLLPVDGPKLPNTANGTYNMLMAGGGLLMAGTILYLYRKLKRNH